jgi:hypothetical protein
MNLELERADLVLRFREVIRFEDAVGTRLRVVRGSVWITQNGDRKDHYLPAARTMSLDRPGLALVQAVEPAELVVWRLVPQISVAAQAARRLARAWRTLVRWIASQRLRDWHEAL